LSRHPIDILKAALQEAKTEAATLRIKTATLAQERNVVIEERNKARARVKELEQQNAVQRENVDEAMRQNTPLSGALEAVVTVLAAKGMAVCGCGQLVKLIGDSLRAHPDRNRNECILGGAHWREALKVLLATSDNAMSGLTQEQMAIRRSRIGGSEIGLRCSASRRTAARWKSSSTRRCRSSARASTWSGAAPSSGRSSSTTRASRT
jgi:hypothetical protein